MYLKATRDLFHLCKPLWVPWLSVHSGSASFWHNKSTIAFAWVWVVNTLCTCRYLRMFCLLLLQHFLEDASLLKIQLPYSNVKLGCLKSYLRWHMCVQSNQFAVLLDSRFIASDPLYRNHLFQIIDKRHSDTISSEGLGDPILNMSLLQRTRKWTSYQGIQHLAFCFCSASCCSFNMRSAWIWKRVLWDGSPTSYMPLG